MKIVVDKVPKTLDECRFKYGGTYYCEGTKYGIYCSLTRDICPLYLNKDNKCDATISFQNIQKK